MKTGKDARDCARVLRQMADAPTTYTAVLIVGLRADGTYDHGVVCPPGVLPRLVATAGTVLQRTTMAVAKQRATLN